MRVPKGRIKNSTLCLTPIRSSSWMKSMLLIWNMVSNFGKTRILKSKLKLPKTFMEISKIQEIFRLTKPKWKTLSLLSSLTEVKSLRFWWKKSRNYQFTTIVTKAPDTVSYQKWFRLNLKNNSRMIIHLTKLKKKKILSKSRLNSLQLFLA
jgi:hypothetical protein